MFVCFEMKIQREGGSEQPMSSVVSERERSRRMCVEAEHES